MRGARAPLTFAAGLGLAVLMGCASAGPASRTACAGFLPPMLLTAGAAPLPPMYLQAAIGGDVTDEIVIDKSGAVRDVRLVHTGLFGLTQAAETSLQTSRFTPASIDRNPVATRVVVTVSLGSAHPVKGLPETSLRVYVPAGESREARWQLRGAIRHLALVAYVGAAAPQGAAIVAVGPDGTERPLATLPASGAPQEFRETVPVDRVFAKAGDFRIQLRESNKPVASTTLTVAEDYTQAIVNACEPLKTQRTSPGR